MEKVLCIDCSEFNKDFEMGMEFIRSNVKSIDKKISNNIILSFEEVFVNILQYNEEKEDLKIYIKLNYSEKFFNVELKDNGNKFNPLLNKEPDISLSAEERDIGGLGVFLLKKFTDYVKYEYCNNYNILSFGVVLNG